MRICVFSDIHGNGPAFDAAYKMIISEKADLNIFLGDLCGYYYDQLEIFEKLTNIQSLYAIRGNHDAIFLDIVEGNKNMREKYCRKYGRSMENLLNKEIKELSKWLSSLSSFIEPAFDIACFHGSPMNFLEDYIYPDSSLDIFLDHTSNVFLLGHTHYPMIRRIDNKIVINPGSLGQPRQGGWPTYAVIDYPHKTVTFRYVFYDKKKLLEQIDIMADENSYLKTVIER